MPGADTSDVTVLHRPGLTVAPATQVTWKSDYSQYQVLGLLTSPHDVLSRYVIHCGRGYRCRTPEFTVEYLTLVRVHV